MLIIITILFLVSFLLALYSMKDFQVPSEIQKLISRRKVKGTIIFLKNKVKHYSSSS